MAYMNIFKTTATEISPLDAFTGNEEKPAVSES